MRPSPTRGTREARAQRRVLQRLVRPKSFGEGARSRGAEGRLAADPSPRNRRTLRFARLGTNHEPPYQNAAGVARSETPQLQVVVSGVRRNVQDRTVVHVT